MLFSCSLSDFDDIDSTENGIKRQKWHVKTNTDKNAMKISIIHRLEKFP